MTTECVWCGRELRHGDRGYCSNTCRQAHHAHAHRRPRPGATGEDTTP